MSSTNSTTTLFKNPNVNLFQTNSAQPQSMFSNAFVGLPRQKTSPFAQQTVPCGFGTQSPATNAFATPQQTSNVFAPQQPTPSPFAQQQQTTNLFGQQQQTTNLFGQQQQTTSPFGTPQQTSNVFAPQQSTTNPFGQQSTLFGNSFGPPQNQQPTGNLFGQPQQQQQQCTPNNNPFGFSQQQVPQGFMPQPANNQFMQQQPFQPSTQPFYQFNQGQQQPFPPFNTFGFPMSQQSMTSPSPYNNSYYHGVFNDVHKKNELAKMKFMNEKRNEGFRQQDFFGNDSTSAHLRNLLNKVEPEGEYMKQIKNCCVSSQNKNYGQSLFTNWPTSPNDFTRKNHDVNKSDHNSNGWAFLQNVPKVGQQSQSPFSSNNYNSNQDWLDRIDYVDQLRPSFSGHGISSKSTPPNLYPSPYNPVKLYDTNKFGRSNKEIAKLTSGRQSWAEYIGKSKNNKDAFPNLFVKHNEQLNVEIPFTNTWKKLDFNKASHELEYELKRANDAEFKRTLFDFGRRCHSYQNGNSTKHSEIISSRQKIGPPLRNDAASWSSLIRARRGPSQFDFGNTFQQSQQQHYSPVGNGARQGNSSTSSQTPTVSYQISTEIGEDEINQSREIRNSAVHRAIAERRQQRSLNDNNENNVEYVERPRTEGQASQRNSTRPFPVFPEFNLNSNLQRNPSFIDINNHQDRGEVPLTTLLQPRATTFTTSTDVIDDDNNDNSSHSVSSSPPTSSRRSRSKRSQFKERTNQNHSGVILTNPEYFCKPIVEALDNLLDSNGDCYVENFEIGHVDWGSVVFPGVVNVAGLNIDKTVQFEQGAVTISPRTEQTQREDLSNHTAIVTYEKFECDPEVSIDIFTEHLRKACKQVGGEFIRYDAGEEKLIFKITKARNAPTA